MSGCSHGKTFKEPCTECQLVLAREGLAWALQSVEKYSKLIADLAPDASGPWVERGTGWAKIHNLPPTHPLNEPQAVREHDRDAVAAIVLKAMQAKVDSDTYGASYAIKINADRAVIAADAILSLSRQTKE